MNMESNQMYANKVATGKLGIENLAAKLKATGKSNNMEAIEKAAEDFEAVFLSEMFNHMFEGIEVNPMFGGGKGEEMWKSMMIQEYGKIVARSGGIGVADYVKKEMLRIQEENLQ